MKVGLDERLFGGLEWAGRLVAMLGCVLELEDANRCSSWGPWKVGSTQVGNTLRGGMAVDTCICCCSLCGCRLLVGITSRSESI